MLNKEAIEHLQAIATAAAGAQIGTTDNGYLIVPKGFDALTLDQFNDRPVHFREEFRTNHLESFGDYLDANDESTCYVNINDMSAKVIFDAGVPDAPGHRLHSATLSLAMSPLYSSVQQIASPRSAITQRTLAEWLEDWRMAVTAENATGEEIDLRKVIAAVRNFSVRGSSGTDHQQESLKASKSAFAQIEAGNKDHIPEFIVAHGAPYLDLPDFDIPMRLSVRLSTDGEPPKFALAVIQSDRLTRDIAETFAKTIREAVGGCRQVLIGSV